MANVQDVLRYSIAKLSDKIRAVKLDALKSEASEQRAYRNIKTGEEISEAVFLKQYSLSPDKKIDGEYWWRSWVAFKRPCIKSVCHINPKHSNWNTYLGLKRAVTANLVALRRTRSRSVAAWSEKYNELGRRMCLRIIVQLQEGKRDFSDVDKWVEERKRERAEVTTSCG